MSEPQRPFYRLMVGTLLPWLLLAGSACAEQPKRQPLRAGASAVDITPQQFPVIVNGSFLEKKATKAYDRLKARALVLDDGVSRVALVVVDSLMLPRALLDEVKQEAQRRTGIPSSRILIAATHTHSAPSAMACLGSRRDDAYVAFLKPRLVQAIERAAARLTEAEIGWTVVPATTLNHCRRWIFRPDRVGRDPFGNPTVRANMHPGYQSPNHIGPAGPADRELTVVAVRRPGGTLMAVLANFAFHYYGTAPVSGDVAGRFGPTLARLLGIDRSEAFVGMLSQGTSGDSMWMDYSRPAPKRDMDAYVGQLARLAASALDRLSYRRRVPLAMAEAELTLRRRVPDEKRLAWARQIVARMGDRLPRNLQEVYAREAIYLARDPVARLKLQAIRIGELGIVAMPNEVYGITGMKIKLASPLPTTFVIELANGAEGYIPPPEQHVLGGYTTWPARTAGLEVTAEPKIVQTVLGLLEKVAGEKRRPIRDPVHRYAQAVRRLKPAGWWRLGEISGTTAHDAAGRHDGRYEPGVVFYLPGPHGEGFAGGRFGNRAAQFAGGRVRVRLGQVPEQYSIAFWFWNGLPDRTRAVTAYLVSLGREGDRQAEGDHVGLGGTAEPGMAGKLFFFNGNRDHTLIVGKTTVPLRRWTHVVFVRDGRRVRLYVDGRLDAEGEAPVTRPVKEVELFLGGRCDRFAPLEGRLDEVAFFNRVLSDDEVAALFEASGLRPLAEAAAAGPTHPESPPLAPSEALRAIHVRPGYRVELVAAEPLVQDPVAIAWGNDGKLWVAEMADYPLGIDGKGKPGGRIRFLEDTDGDGRYDRSVVFLESLPFPNGVMPWRGGVLITSAPNILYAEDTDGDGRADRTEILFSGFHEGNQQLRVNGLRWGLDNWVHCANGRHRAGYRGADQVVSVKTGRQLLLGSRDFRFQPDTGRLDPESGPSQFGRTRDDWGNWFGCMNSWPMWHYVLPDRYLRRNPHFVPPDPRHQLFTPMNPRVYPAKEPQKRYHSFTQSGRFTSACSPLLYRDELLFDRNDLERTVFDGAVYHVFACEPFHNLVQHRIAEADGISFRARRDPADGPVDFFAARDRWCRPVMVRTGPDGALWVVDMYRYMIEHPEFLPPAGRQELQPVYRAGSDRGRIYRILPEGKQARHVPPIHRLNSRAVVDLLGHPNGTVRDMAHMELIWRGATEVAGKLAEFVRKHPSPLARLHALCVLEGLKKLDDEVLLAALADRHPGVRRQAVRLAESWPEDSRVAQSVAELIDDPDARVRLQVAFSLGTWHSEWAAKALAALAERAASENRWFAAAVLSSLHGDNVGPVLEIAARQGGYFAEGAVSTAVGMKQYELVSKVLRKVLDEGSGTLLNKFSLVTTVLEAARRAGWDVWQDDQLARQISRLTAVAGRVAADRRAEVPLRVAAIGLLARREAALGGELELLAGLLGPQHPPDVQNAALRRLGEIDAERVAELLLDGWSGYSVSLRRAVIQTLSSRQTWRAALLRALEQGKVAPGEIDAAARQALLHSASGKQRDRLARVFARSRAPRADVVARFRSALELEGDVTRGIQVFERACAACHRVRGVGNEVGPNLASLTDRRPLSLLTAILDPNASVDGRYVSYVVLLRDGRVLTGMIARETAGAIVLVDQDGQERAVPRAEIEALRGTGKSLMPEGLEEQLSAQDIADLIALLRSL